MHQIAIPDIGADPSAQAILEILDHHLAQRPAEIIGNGLDAYLDQPIDHPMAYAMYARGLLGLYRIRGRSEDLASAEVALERLAALSSAAAGAWGLRFAWRQLPSEHPYTITTAICALAFAEHHMLTSSRQSLSRCTDACRWLATGVPWSICRRGAGPWFAPGIPYVIPNVTAMAGSALAHGYRLTGLDLFARAAKSAGDYVVGAQDIEGLWTYGSTGLSTQQAVNPERVIDVIHTSYTLDGLLGMILADSQTNPSMLRALSSGLRFLFRQFFDSQGRCIEKLVLRSTDEENNSLLENPRLALRPLVQGKALIAFPQESRLWGYGAALGVAGRATKAGYLSRNSVDRAMYRVLQLNAADFNGRFRYLPSDASAFPRHEAHLFEGLTTWLSTASDERVPATAS